MVCNIYLCACARGKVIGLRTCCTYVIYGPTTISSTLAILSMVALVRAVYVYQRGTIKDRIYLIDFI